MRRCARACPGQARCRPLLSAEQLAEHRDGLIVLTGCRRGLLSSALLRGDPAAAQAGAGLLVDLFGQERVVVELQDHALPGDRALVRGLLGVARALGLPVVATGNTHYATQDHARLRDCLLAIDANLSLTEARKRGLLPHNHMQALPAPAEMLRRFAELPEALPASLEIAARCQVDLDFGQHRLPQVHVPGGVSEFSHLYQLCHQALPDRYPSLAPRVLKQLAHELDVIERAGLAPFFLIVADIVRFARERGIRCSGRGSAAGSIVSYLLGISHCCPFEHDLLFERFLSDDKHTMPDIDIDFDSFRREEVIQYVYEKYGHERVAMVTNYVTYQTRSAIRDLGAALAFPEAVLDRLVKQIDSHSAADAATQLEALAVSSDANAGDDPHPINTLAGLVRQIDGAVRHLGIHSGGMVITGPPLSQVVPVQPATMPGRYIIEWDKDSCEDAGLIKIDILGLRTLGMIDHALDIVERQTGARPDVNRMPLDEPALWEMLARADTIGTFQVESRAQTQMLPRTKPREHPRSGGRDRDHPAGSGAGRRGASVSANGAPGWSRSAMTIPRWRQF